MRLPDGAFPAGYHGPRRVFAMLGSGEHDAPDVERHRAMSSAYAHF